MTLGLLTLTLLLTAGAWASRERDRWVDHTLDVLRHLELYEASVLAVQVRTAEQTVWTEGSLGRQAVETSLTNALSSLNTLITLTDDNPQQAVRVRMLKSLTEQARERIRLQWMAPRILAAGNAWTDLPVSETVNEIRRDERATLNKRQAAQARADSSFWVLTGFAVVANLFIVWWAYAASRRYMSERNETEHEVRELNTKLAHQVVAIRSLNSSLEERVSAKTAELEAIVGKLKASNQELERFAYVASHDMQEPLRQVASFNNLLALKYSNKLDATANRYLDYSVSGAKRLQLMLRGLLQYTMTTQAAVYRSEIPITALLDQVRQELQPEIEQAGADVHFPNVDGLSVVGDREMIRTLVQALLSNAIKFRRPDVPAVVNVAFERRTDHWTIAVADNGIGIEQRLVPRVFEMFARFHPVGQYQGAGVGLALSKRIVDCHDGKFSVEKNPEGPGTVFKVEIPILSKGVSHALETGRFPY